MLRRIILDSAFHGDVDARDKEGRTPLHMALQQRLKDQLGESPPIAMDTVRLLLELNANVNLCDVRLGT